MARMALRQADTRTWRAATSGVHSA